MTMKKTKTSEQTTLKLAPETVAPETKKKPAKKKDVKPAKKKDVKPAKAKAVPERARSPLVQAIYKHLEGKGWVKRDELVKAVGKVVDVKAAKKVYDQRIQQGEKEAVQVQRGRSMQVTLTCITLVQNEKLEQKG